MADNKKNPAITQKKFVDTKKSDAAGVVRRSTATAGVLSPDMTPRPQKKIVKPKENK